MTRPPGWACIRTATSAARRPSCRSASATAACSASATQKDAAGHGATSSWSRGMPSSSAAHRGSPSMVYPKRCPPPKIWASGFAAVGSTSRCVSRAWNDGPEVRTTTSERSFNDVLVNALGRRAGKSHLVQGQAGTGIVKAVHDGGELGECGHRRGGYASVSGQGDPGHQSPADVLMQVTVIESGRRLHRPDRHTGLQRLVHPAGTGSGRGGVSRAVQDFLEWGGGGP